MEDQQQRAQVAQRQLAEEIDLIQSVLSAKGWPLVRKMLAATADQQHAVASKAVDPTTMARALGAEDAYRAMTTMLESLISARHTASNAHKG
jgi:hypothetical protein